MRYCVSVAVPTQVNFASNVGVSADVSGAGFIGGQGADFIGGQVAGFIGGQEAGFIGGQDAGFVGGQGSTLAVSEYHFYFSLYVS